MKKPIKVVSFTSGKGGVGKTNLIVNTSLELLRRGKKVLLIDSDLGLANVDVVLGLAPKYNLHHLFSGEKTIEEIMVDGPNGLKILPASSGIQEMTNLTNEERFGFLNAVEQTGNFDYIMLDTGAGISDNVLYFNSSAQDIFVIITPEPTSLTDGYAIIKVLNTKYKINRFKIITNMVKTRLEGEQVFERLSKVASHFLNVGLDFAGFVYKDSTITQSVVKQTPFSILYPNSKSSACIRSIVDKMEKPGFLNSSAESVQMFWQKMVSR
jgi:flagellar biosynthesis protein FlhG